MPLASVGPRDLRTFHVTAVTKNIEPCGFGRFYVIRVSVGMSQCNGNRYTKDRADTGSRKFVRKHGSSLPTEKTAP